MAVVLHQAPFTAAQIAMPSFFIHMSQGLAADLRNHTICSGQFSTCAPIVFYNKDTHWGGLYHLGGCDSLKPLATGHLRQMETLVRPTDIYILCGDSTDDPLFGASGHISAAHRRRRIERDYQDPKQDFGLAISTGHPASSF